MIKITPAALRAAASGEIENFIAATTPGGIEAQEKRGQIEQSFRETLPLVGTEKREVWEKLGFVFGNTIDRIFVEAKFPKGWRKQPTDHDMWSNLLDDKGRKRGAIFYKAAFYDRSAHISLQRRYSYSTEPEGGWGNAVNKSFIGVAKDGDSIIFKTEPTSPEPDGGAERDKRMAWYAEKDAKASEARAWLDAQYPNWQDVSAYWG